MPMNEKGLAYSNQAAVLPERWSANHRVAPENSGSVDSLLHPVAILLRQVLTRPGRQDLNLILIDDEENIIQALEAGVDLHSLYFSGNEKISDELMCRLPFHIK